MEYTGKYRSMFSEELGEQVNILEYRAKDARFPWCECDKCHKPIVRKMFVVQDKDDVEVFCLGADCIKKFR